MRLTHLLQTYVERELPLRDLDREIDLDSALLLERDRSFSLSSEGDFERFLSWDWERDLERETESE